MPDELYDVAQVCMSGHVTNSGTRDYPEHNQEFCKICGKKTITQCPWCSKTIRGAHRMAAPRSPFSAPAFCIECGKPYPWTASRLEAARSLADEIDGLSEPERITLKSTLDDLIRDTPMTAVAAVRFKKLVARGGKQVADAFKDILVDIVSESVRKSLWG